MDETQSVAWMARRLTFGEGIAHLDAWLADGAARVRDSLTTESPATASSPWDGLELPTELSRESVPVLLTAWLDHLRTSARPFDSWMTWFWHDYFAVSAVQVQDLSAFTGHIDLLTNRGLAGFSSLLEAVTVDPAMLIFLDGRRNQAGSVNENYGRELLELYGLGIGNYTEDDVRAAAVALTGWVYVPELGDARFIPRRHDPTVQTLLGDPVDDVESVIATVTSHPACGPHVTQALATGILGRPLEASDLADVSWAFVESGLDLRALATDLIDRALAGEAAEIVLSPIQWLLQAESLTSAELPAEARISLLRQMGQLPGVPPNVGGYPGADTWAGPSTTVGRFRAASAIAALTPDEAPVLESTRARDWQAVASAAARPDGFSDVTIRALDDSDPNRRNGREALAAVLMSPEMAVA